MSNAGEIILTAVGVAGGAGGAIAAWWQANTASKERVEAQEAKADAEAAQQRAEDARDEALELERKASLAAERQAEALEKANVLSATSIAALKQQTSQDWSAAKRISARELSFTNTSGHTLVVTEVVSVPPGEPALRATSYPIFVEHGDHFKIYWDSPYAQDEPKRVKIEWHFEDEHFDPQVSYRNI